MAFELDINIDDDLYTLETINFRDMSNYGTPNILQSSVNATRFLFKTPLSVNNISTNVIELKANKQYTITGTGSIIIDTKTFNAGDTFILMVDATVTPLSTMSINETGIFSPVTSFVPIDINSVASFVPTQTGQSSGVIYNDSILGTQYEIYTTSHNPGVVTVSASTNYFVKGSTGCTITISGVTYRQGEVFTKTSNFTFANGVGNNTIIEFYQTSTAYFMLYYYANIVYEKYIRAISDNNNCSSNLQSNFLSVHTLLNADLINLDKSLVVDIQAMQNNLDTINTRYSNLNPSC